MSRKRRNGIFIGWALSTPADERWRTVAHLISVIPSRHAPELIEQLAACDRRRKYGPPKEKLYELGASYVCEVCKGIAAAHRISNKLTAPAIKKRAA